MEGVEGGSRALAPLCLPPLTHHDSEPIERSQSIVTLLLTQLTHFLDRSTHLYMRVCPSGRMVGRSDDPSVGP